MGAGVPDRIGDYDIVRVIGRGGMGVLYHARDRRHQRDVALKVMSADIIEDEEARARFRHEARLAARVQHRNLVRVFELGDDGDVPFIAMELLHGRTLADWLASGEAMPLARKLDVVVQLCEGLQVLHDAGVVHRDVKPGNIWLLENSGVKLLDLGIAKHAAANLTQAGNVMGSVAYMAPEQLSGQGVDRRADVFSAGVVLYELLSGQRPFQAESITAVMMKVLHDPPPDIRRLVPGISQDLAHALAMALQKVPADRYPEAADLAMDLRLARDAGEVSPPPPEVPDIDLAIDQTIRLAPDRASVGGAEPLLRDTLNTSPAMPLPVPPPAPQAGRGWLVWGGALAGVAAAAGLAVWLASSAPPTYVLDVRSTPGGAEIHVDGAATGQRTPAVLTLLSRPARLGLSLSGYEHIDQPLASTTDLEMTLEYTLRRLLQVQSQPPGARIVVDGQDTGLVTPAVLPLGGEPPTGVELRLDGYESHTAPVTPATLEGGTVSVTLTETPREPPRPPPPGPARPVQVAVSLSGSYPFAVTGCGLNAPALDRHTVNVTPPCTLRLRAPDYFLDVTRSVAAAAGGHMTLSAPPLGRVQLRSRHEDCTLIFAGRAVGSPPVDLDIAAGSYSAALQCPDGQTLQTRTFEIEARTYSRRIDDYLR